MEACLSSAPYGDEHNDSVIDMPEIATPLPPDALPCDPALPDADSTRFAGLRLLMDSVGEEFKPPRCGTKSEKKSHPAEFVVTGTRVGVDGTYRRTSLEVEGVPLYSRLGDMAYMAVQDGRWVLWGGSDKKMVRSVCSHGGKTPAEIKSWEELKTLTHDNSGAEQPDDSSAKPEKRLGYLAKLRIRVFEVPELERVPPNIRAGPWSPVAVFALALIGLSVGFVASFAYDGYPFVGSPGEGNFDPIEPWGGIWRTLLGLYCVGIYFTKLAATSDPLQRMISVTSFTMICWKVLTLRLLLAGLSTWATWLERPAELLRFPALCGASVTVGIWWAVIVPVAVCVLFRSVQQRKGFMLLQTDFFLIHVHALNILFAALDHSGIGGGRRLLTMSDLLLALAGGMLYLCVYLSYHDPRGYHIYLVLSPRLHTCALVYAVMFALFVAFWYAWKEVHP